MSKPGWNMTAFAEKGYVTGTVKSVDASAGRVTVAFDSAGEKTLATRLAKMEMI